MRIGVQITDICNYECDHCMFSCTKKGSHMNDEVIEKTSKFISDNKINEINIYGGEPFIDMEHFLKCYDAFTNHKYDNIFISTNGSFLSSPKKFKQIKQFCNEIFTYNRGDLSAIRISNTTYHNEYRSYNFQTKLEKFKHNLDYDTPYEFMWKTNDHCYGTCFYIDRESHDRINPSGRAIDNGLYNNKELCCPITEFKRNSYDNYEEMFDDVATINVYVDGSIGLCCYGKCGTMGTIFDYDSDDELINDSKVFVKNIVDTYTSKGYDNYPMIDICNTCRKCSCKSSDLKLTNNNIRE